LSGDACRRADLRRAIASVWLSPVQKEEREREEVCEGVL
jgi:hypothetical protein